MVALVGEFSSTSKSAVAIGLPLEFHRQAHKGFTEFGLHQVRKIRGDGRGPDTSTNE
jgi:hypothetical protein